jgi:PIN domain nuclease of toxin-antitoxin system
MKILVDTHILLWWYYSPEKITSEHIKILKNPDNEVLISVASLIEIGIKKGIKKLDIPHKTTELLSASEFTELPVKHSHIDFMDKIYWLHKDPFDKIIISQAISENLFVMSYDRIFIDYKLKLV